MNNPCKPRMLIVDDEEGMRTTLQRIMVAKGFDVHLASDGREAIELAKELLPHVILLDIRMPGLNGVEAFREIKPCCPDAVTVFMTAYSSSELSQEAIDEGAAEVLPKPLDVDHLCELIRRSSSSRPLLIVDDDNGFCTSLKRALTTAGYQVNTASEVDEALDKFRRRPRSIALLDMKLDGNSGLNVLQQIRAVNPDAIVVLMTGFAELEAEMLAGLGDGACCTFVKPFEVDSLVTAIESQLIRT